MSTKAELYVKARLEGLGTRAAAREAGFAFGRPSAQARDLLKRVVALRTTPGLKEAILKERAELAPRIAKLDAALAAHRLWDRAKELLDASKGEQPS